MAAALLLISRRTPVSARLLGLGDLNSLVRTQAVGEDLRTPGRPRDLDAIDFVGIAQTEIERENTLGQVPRICRRYIVSRYFHRRAHAQWRLNRYGLRRFRSVERPALISLPTVGLARLPRQELRLL
jgi:hypothetical protein